MVVNKIDDISKYDVVDCIGVEIAGANEISTNSSELNVQRRYIKVIGVGGAGGNAINDLAETGIEGVQLVACNTDTQALYANRAEKKIQLGKKLTEGLGAGNDPSVGNDAAIEASSEIDDLFADFTKMVFVTAGMGGGTGTGAAPVIAKSAKSKGILTVGVVSLPFSDEGPTRIRQANEGIKAMRAAVDALLVINVDKLMDEEEYLKMGLDDAFKFANNVIVAATKGIAEIMTRPGQVNVDFRDVNGVLKDSGVALFGNATATGENRALDAIKEALNSPLLHDNDIRKAKNTILNITTSSQHKFLTGEKQKIFDYIKQKTGRDNDFIYGVCFDESVGEALHLTIIVIGFDFDEEPIMMPQATETISLGDSLPEMEIKLNEKEIRTRENFGLFKDLDALCNDNVLKQLEEQPAIDRKVKSDK